MKNITSVILAIFLTICCVSCTTTNPNPPPATHPSFEAFVTSPKNMVGYGFVNKWIQLSEPEIEEFANLLVENGVNCTQVELLSFAKDGYYRNVDAAIDKFIKFADIMQSRKITILVTIVNWNAGGGGVSENGNDSICGSYFGDSWFNHIIDRLIGEVGTEGIIVETASEWSPNGRNGQCSSKAKQWDDIMKSKWKGMKSWNAGSRPSSAPSGYFLDWHVDKANQLGPKSSNKIVVTDTSGILNYLGGLRIRNYASNADRLAKIVKDCKKEGCGFIMYGFSPPSLDKNAIITIGNAWKQ